MFDTFRYECRKLGAKLAGKGVIGGTVAGVKLAAPGFVQLGGVITTVSATLGAGLTVMLAQIGFRHEREQLLEQYRPEISALTGKSPHALDQDDLRRVALGDPERHVEGNPIIADAYQRASTKWWLKVGVGVLAGLATLAVVTFAAPALLAALAVAPALPVIATSLAGHALTVTAAQVAQITLGAGVGFLLGNAMGAVAEKAVGINRAPADEKIRRLGRILRGSGNEITHEQVMEVCLAAHPKLDKQIAKTHGDRFEHLGYREKQAVIQEYGPRFNLERVTSDLNHRQIRANELAFALVGQESGIPRLAEPPPNWKHQAKEYAGVAAERGKEALSHVWSKGRHMVERGLVEGREKLSDAGRYLSGFHNAEVQGVTLPPEKSAEHLALLDSVKGKWERLVSNRAQPAMEIS